MSEYLKVPESELKNRIEKLQRNLKNLEIDGAIILDNANLFYFTGSCQNGHLIVPAEGEPVYLVRKSFERAREESELSDIRIQKGFKSVGEVLLETLGKNPVVGMELDILPVNQYQRYKKRLEVSDIKDVSGEISLIRAIKSDFELGIIKEAALMHRRMMEYVSEILEPGMKEIELASKVEEFLRRSGHQGYVRMRGFNQEIFYGHIISGDNLNYPSFISSPTGGAGLSPAFPQSAGRKVIEKDEPVMIDYVSVKDGYIVDQTRIFCMGKLPEEMEKAHETAIKIHKEIQNIAKAGVTWELLHEMAHKVAEEEGFGDNFMGYHEKTPFVGHGVGLELDEIPILAKGLDSPLENGMVFALEPKMFFPGKGAVGLEDTYLITEEGVEKITSFEESINYI